MYGIKMFSSQSFYTGQYLLQYFGNILVCGMYITWPKQFRSWLVSTVVGSIVRFCALLHSVCYLKAVQMNVQCSLKQELMLYEFKLDHNALEATRKNCVKSEDAVDHGTVTRWVKKFCSSRKNLNEQARSDRPKTIESDAVFHAIQANLVSSTRRVSGVFGISKSNMVHHPNNIGKNIRSCQIIPHVSKTLQNFWLSLVI